MAIFLVTTPLEEPSHQAELEGALQQFERRLRISSGQWLVAAPGTAHQISDQLGVTGPNERQALARLPVVIVQVATYYGRGNPEWWEWMKTNWEATTRG